MRLIIFLVLLFLQNSICFCQHFNFEVSGDISTSKVPKIYIRYNNNEKVIVDSCVVKNGKFNYKGFVKSPSTASISDLVYMLDFKPSFIVHPNDVLQFHFKENDFEKAYYTGSKDNMLLNEYNKNVFAIDSIFRFETKNLSDDDSLYHIASNSRKNKIFEYDKQIVSSNPDSYVSISLLYSILKADGTLADSLFRNLNDSLKSTFGAQKCLSVINIKNLSAIGKHAPLFSLKDSTGKYHSLDSFNGKYVLVDFWASWCGPCRAENPNFIKAYNYYKDKNFDFIGISIDDDRHYIEWKEAIVHDNTPWLQLLDDKKENVADGYGIFYIPDNVLINPDGIIVAKALRGEKLWRTLEKYLK